MGCHGINCTCTKTEEQYIWIDDKTLYLQHQTYQTPSLANPPDYDDSEVPLLHVPVTGLGNVYSRQIRYHREIGETSCPRILSREELVR